MRALLTSTAVGLITAFTLQAQAQTSEQKAALDDPCAAQWVAVDANEDGKISKSEAQDAIEPQFSRIDDDGDGVVSVKEWKDCSAPSAIPGGFQSAAGTGTEQTPPGALTEGDTAEQTEGEPAETTAEAGQDEMTSTRALQATPDVTGVGEPRTWSDEAFAEMDVDESGDVTAEEAAEWSKNRVTGTMQDQEETLARHAGIFGLMDTDSDGTITQEEWQQRQQLDVEDRFARVDEDGDGEITQNEWRDYREQRFDQAQATTRDDEGVTIWMYYFRVL